MKFTFLIFLSLISASHANAGSCGSGPANGSSAEESTANFAPTNSQLLERCAQQSGMSATSGAIFAAREIVRTTDDASKFISLISTTTAFAGPAALSLELSAQHRASILAYVRCIETTFGK